MCHLQWWICLFLLVLLSKLSFIDHFTSWWICFQPVLMKLEENATCPLFHLSSGRFKEYGSPIYHFQAQWAAKNMFSCTDVATWPHTATDVPLLTPVPLPRMPLPTFLYPYSPGELFIFQAPLGVCLWLWLFVCTPTSSAITCNEPRARRGVSGQQALTGLKSVLPSRNSALWVISPQIKSTA